jgi:hypothetical protein
MHSSDTYANSVSRERARLRITHTCLDPFVALRVERGAQHLHTLGARATAELLLEIGHRIGGLPCIISLLTEFERRITPGMLRASGGDKFPARFSVIDDGGAS